MKKNRKWNWFDALIILVIVGIAVFVFKKSDVNTNNAAASQPTNQKEMVMTVEVKNVTDALCKGFAKGDQLMALNKLQEGTIESVTVVNSIKASPNNNGVMTKYEDTVDKTAIVVIHSKVVDDKTKPYIEIGGQPAKVGLNYYVKTSKGELYGKIKKVEVR
jgi:hypothetical protein